MRTWLARICVLLFVALLSSMASLVQPAWACGCGAMVSNSELRVGDEAAIVRWDGRTEQIVLRLGVDSLAADAALIFPTPSVASVKLGERRWFSQIDLLTAPGNRAQRDWWPRWKGVDGVGAGSRAPGGSVNVLDEQQLGSLVVATLDATDAGALAGWLRTNGYQLRPELARSLDVYVKMRWKYVAVKLAPRSEQALNGHLDPLHLSFASDRLVYPMSISHQATSPQFVHLWVVAPHRVERIDADASTVPAPVRFAGQVSGLSGSLSAFVGRDQWLTEFEVQIFRPGEITSDWQFGYAATDIGMRELHVSYDPVYILGVPGGWFLVGLSLIGLAVLLATIAHLVRRGRRAVRVSP